MLRFRKTIRAFFAVVVLTFLAACTDYVGQIDEQIDEYDAHETARLESLIPVSESYVKPSSVVKGTLVDERDGQSYRTVAIGALTWMAENLNYETANSYCYKDADTNCAVYGRLYTWAAAMDSVGKWSESAKGCGDGRLCAPTYPVRGVCPEGWHIPSMGEWTSLKSATGETFSHSCSADSKEKGGSCILNTDDEYGFDILLAGSRQDDGKYYGEGSTAYFWTSSEDNNFSANSYNWSFNSLGPSGGERKFWGLSVRCVKVTDGKDSTDSSSPEILKGTLEDSRDGKSYKTVVIGSQTWMAENLNYETEDSRCFNDSTKYCDKYGRLYAWEDAMEACPAEWHLPTKVEWRTLLATVGGDSVAGKKLKSTIWWPSGGQGTDDYGFSAYPAGYGKTNGYSENESVGTFFWSSTENTSTEVTAMYLYRLWKKASIGRSEKNFWASVRCIKGSVEENRAESSSSQIPESSSSSVSSSSLCIPPEDADGFFTDVRDCRTYRTVVIGTQTWMAENLDYEAADSYCYNDSADYCDKYGRLYSWAATMDSAAVWNVNGMGCSETERCHPIYPVQGVCPSGWHVPTIEEWDTLYAAVGEDTAVEEMLKSSDGWINGSDGTDSYGFSVLPGGYIDGLGLWGEGDSTPISCGEGFSARFWSSSQDYEKTVSKITIGTVFSYDNCSSQNSGMFHSVRCVKD